MVDPVPRDDVQEGGRLEAGIEHGAPALGEGGVQPGRAARVEEQRDVLQHGLALGGGQLGGVAGDGGQCVAVGEHRGLRDAGRAARGRQHVDGRGVEAAGGVVGRGDGDEIVEVEREAVISAEADDVLDGCDRRAELAGQGSEAGVGEQRPRLHVAQVRRQLGQRQPDVERRAGHPRLGAGEEEGQVGGAVRGEDGDAVAHPETKCVHEDVRQPRRPIVELRPRPPAAVDLDHRVVVSEAPRVPAHDVGDQHAMRASCPSLVSGPPQPMAGVGCSSAFGSRSSLQADRRLPKGPPPSRALWGSDRRLLARPTQR